MPFIDNFIPSAGHGYGPQVSVVNAFEGGAAFNNDFYFLRRPFLDDRGRACVLVNTGRWTTERGQKHPIRERRLAVELLNQGYPIPPVFNATSLRKEEWIELDRVVLKEYRARLRAWSDLVAANTYGGFNAMSRMTVEYEAMSDPGVAVVDFDGLTEGRTDSPLYKLRSLPLPITHSDFWFSSRRLAISGNTGTPLDSTMAEAAARRIGERIEKGTIGTVTGPSYGYQSAGITAHDSTIGSQVYGYLTYPHRLTKADMTAPTTGGWTPETTLNEFLVCLESLYTNNFFGPFMVYNSTDWDKYLDGDYYVAKTSGAVAPTITLRDRLKRIAGIQDIRRLDFLRPTALAISHIEGTNPFTFIFVQMTSDVARAINGMEPTTVQWETVGGMRLNFKILCIQVPHLRSDYQERCGILQATTA